MGVTLRLMLACFCLLFFFAVVRLVSRGRLQLKYSLLWMAMSLALILCAVAPDLVGAIAKLLGIGLASNFVFLVGFVILLGICLSLTVIVSWQSRDIRQMIQHLALIEKRLSDADDPSDRDATD
ncbi:DUF2304 domain-containing protein [Olsenella urininfantis]|uniref:DUF2304 domain-containing protein n=1 Tax=Olsenella urininfantis TaxID=1871033 RepID=UPI0009874956|nr:DUF2304 domain-containing protein [Olsenella urininfantis]